MLTRFAFAAWITASLVPFAAAQTASRADPKGEELVKIEVKIVAIADDFFERICVNFERQGEKVETLDKSAEVDKLFGCGNAKQLIFLDAKQCEKLLNCLVGDIRTNIEQSPSAIVSNGKIARLSCTNKHYSGTTAKEYVTTGYKLSIRPTIANERRTVAVKLKGSLSSLESEKPLRITTLALEDELNIPAGQTAVLGGWKRQREELVKCKPPVGNLPYVSRLFKTVGYTRTTENVLVLVTATIVDKEEKRSNGEPSVRAQKRVAAMAKEFNEFFEQGKYAEAERCALKALERDADEPIAKAALTMARFYLHEKKTAGVR